MGDNSYKPLYFAKSFKDLEEKAEVSAISKVAPNKCHDRMSQCNKRAMNAKKTNDQELEFIYLHRYLTLLSNATRDPNVTTKNASWNKELQIAKINEKNYVKLRSKLQARYQERIEKNKSITSCITVYPSENSSLSKGYSSDAKTEKKQKQGEIDSFELHKLVIGQSQETFLIMDVRPKGHFEESHINHKNVLNVSSDKISLGISANGLGMKFVDNDSKNLWKMRGDVDKIILLDWWSSLKNLEMNAPLKHLKDILLKWDHEVQYKCMPLILEGGYEELINTFPQITTNAKVLPPLQNTSSKNNSLSSFDYPMEELEPEKENIPKNVSSTKVTVDRSSKPQRQKIELNGLIKHTNNLNEDVNSDASIISSSDTEQQQSVNSLKLTDKISNKSTLLSKEENISTKKDQVGYPTKSLYEESDVSHNNNNSKPFNDSRNESPTSDSSQDESSQIKQGSPQRQLNELRKLKPQFSNKTIAMNNYKKRDDNVEPEAEILTTPLKKDGGSGGLKRSSSSPNIAQMKDDDSFHIKHPFYSRTNKPTSNIPHTTYGERTDSTYGTTSAGLTGLKNFANNCYMNSILQCLNNTESLVKEMTALNKHTLNHHSRSKGRVAQEVIDAFRNMWSGEIRVYSIKDLKAIMGNIKDIFKGTAHQDSNEFLIILLEHLHEDLNKPAELNILDGADVESGERAWGEFKRKNCSVIQRLFYGQHKSTVTCSTCNHTSATFEQFFNLFVPIPTIQSGTVTLNDCIQHYMSGERISGWKCPKCNAERNATKKFDISQLPPILVIALKRFTQDDDSWLQKKENIVQYPLEDLDMSRFTVAGSEQRYSRYNLYAMSIHSGTLKSGHYRAICRNYKNQKWYLFDDQTVEPLHVQNVKNNPEVYILFYNAVKH